MKHSTLSALDSSIYPIVWEQQTFSDAHSLLMALITGGITLEAKDFAHWLLSNDIYQQWINFTVFGRYVQRSFAAFYRQSEDSFNTDMPDLLRHELMRHAQYLPMTQTLFFAGELPRTARQEKLFSTTLNPLTAWQQAQASPVLLASRQTCLIINLLQIASHQVLGFAVRHNKRTSERLQSEVMILDFRDLRLISEKCLSNTNVERTDSVNASPSVPIYLRHYEIK